jgi:hypothetical protein
MTGDGVSLLDALDVAICCCSLLFALVRFVKNNAN